MKLDRHFATMVLVIGMTQVSCNKKAPPTAETSSFRAGQSVAARWKGGSMYWSGKITTCAGSKCDIVYDDGDRETVDQANILPMSATLNVGDKVIATWIAASMYPGTITKKSASAYTINWDDGSPSKEVPFEKVAKAPSAAKP